MDLNSLIAKLHPLERAVLPVLQKERELSAIARASKLDETEAMRALQWLENKKILTLKSKPTRVLVLGVNGKKYQQEGLPEKKILNVLTKEFQGMSVIARKANVSDEEVNACIGVLKRKSAIDLLKGKELMAKLGPQGDTYKQAFPEERFLKRSFPLPFDSLTEEDRLALDDLQKRKELVKVEEQKRITVELTELGRKLAATKIDGDVVNRLTTEMLVTGNWKKKKFRAYDVEINVPRIFGGRKHFENEAISYIRRIWLDMGFTEMTGKYVQSAFWDMDALFVPQDHPAREMQDTFYLSRKAKLPKLWEKIQKVHENGADTGSKGWQTPFSKEETQKILLRTHTTVLSAQTLSKLKKEDLPAKFFAIGKVFRNEALDWKHLFAFYQVEGIVVDPHANLKHLKGYLREFYQKMGYEKVRMRPAHFPYTEPSLEVDVFHPVKKEWVELGGAGIFRPEVVKPLLGFDCPVLAWGQGMGRIIGEYWKMTDVRDLYKNDVKQSREMKAWLR
ncbi:phenylalanine--tRNA ligase subunit alpha [Candidatus Woesearchaeota archaeon]|nr:phenylalanine--tRNA ligase subunit alpha [Candidatus Woesearchaeota archaeon]